MEDLFDDLIDSDNEQEISVVLGGGDTISLDSMISSLKAIQELSESALRKKNSGGFHKVVFKKAQPGSSIITDIGLYAQIGINLLPVAKLFFDVLALRKDLKGKGPININIGFNNTISIVTNYLGEEYQHNTETIETYGKNPNIERNFNHMGNKLAKENRTSVEFIAKNTELRETLSSEDIKNFSKKIDTSKILSKKEEVISEETLELRTPKYNSNAMWEFVNNNGQIIDVKILDKLFMERINSGELLTTGTTQIRFDLITITEENMLYENNSIKIKYFAQRIYEIQNTNSENVVTRTNL